MHNKTVIDVIFDAKDEFLAICSERALELLSTVIFMLFIPWGRKFWLHILHFSMFTKGVACLFVPTTLTKMVIVEAKAELDDVHISILQVTGLMMVLWVLSYWLLSKSTDSTVITSYLWILAIMMTCSLLCTGYIMAHPGTKGVRLDPKMMTAAFYTLLLFTLGTYYYAMRSNDWAGYSEVPSQANLHLRLDFVILLMTGVSMFALPQWFLSWQIKAEKMDSVHAYLSRNAAAMNIAMGLLAGRSANFLRGSDKHCVAFTHFLYFVIAISVGYYYKWDDIMLLPKLQIITFVIIDLLMTLNAFAALDFKLTVLETVKTRAQQMPQDLRLMYFDIRNMIKLKRF